MIRFSSRHRLNCRAGTLVNCCWPAFSRSSPNWRSSAGLRSRCGSLLTSRTLIRLPLQGRSAGAALAKPGRRRGRSDLGHLFVELDVFSGRRRARRGSVPADCFCVCPIGTNRQPANECGPQAPRRAYSWNLLGSFLAGVLFFFL
jgi:hypothetical protein